VDTKLRGTKAWIPRTSGSVAPSRLVVGQAFDASYAVFSLGADQDAGFAGERHPRQVVAAREKP